MDTIKTKRAHISYHDAAKHFTDKYGVDIFLGHAKFISPTEVSVNGKTLTFSKACIASGARPTVP
jgi:pyruvate/2-oxoglutarate dehydrogenase complex dihydrolipoamide dehydrogenase (E3) component